MGPVRGLQPDALVSELIDEDLCCWKQSLLNECFDHYEGRQIGGIPLPRNGDRDKMIWHWEKDGNYSVRTAYHLLVSKRDAAKVGTSGTADESLWKLLWKAPVHVRIKNFLWRLCHNILPLRTNLLKKGIHIDPSCPFCDRSPETLDHLFCHCDVTKMIWFSSPLGLRLDPTADPLMVLTKGLSDRNLFVNQLMCTMLWQIWKARNKCVFEGVTVSPPKVVSDSVNYLAEFNCFIPQDRRLQQTENAAPRECPDDVFLVQVDAGCFNDGTVAMGCVIKKHNDEVIVAASKRMEVSVSPSTAEAMAIRWGLQVARDLKLQKIVVQSDALVVVDCVNKMDFSVVLEPIVLDCSEIKLYFDVVTVMYVSRNFNTDAHHMVSIGKTAGCRTWLGFIPKLDSVCTHLPMMGS
ncbi:uncharacterized protein LOC131611980 [Vicia villosa]|uniref:uncharacterized protein LOC131611980 n=1 Tax=Vicia villosa TaxID=3911 RepID=UPI00273C1D53|nr:uncharacterized protein LOC131611980 [Vicia villosa]